MGNGLFAIGNRSFEKKYSIFVFFFKLYPVIPQYIHLTVSNFMGNSIGLKRVKLVIIGHRQIPEARTQQTYQKVLKMPSRHYCIYQART